MKLTKKALNWLAIIALIIIIIIICLFSSCGNQKTKITAAPEQTTTATAIETEIEAKEVTPEPFEVFLFNEEQQTYESIARTGNIGFYVVIKDAMLDENGNRTTLGMQFRLMALEAYELIGYEAEYVSVERFYQNFTGEKKTTVDGKDIVVSGNDAVYLMRIYGKTTTDTISLNVNSKVNDKNVIGCDRGSNASNELVWNKTIIENTIVSVPVEKVKPVITVTWAKSKIMEYESNTAWITCNVEFNKIKGINLESMLTPYNYNYDSIKFEKVDSKTMKVTFYRCQQVEKANSKTECRLGIASGTFMYSDGSKNGTYKSEDFFRIIAKNSNNGGGSSSGGGSSDRDKTPEGPLNEAGDGAGKTPGSDSNDRVTEDSKYTGFVSGGNSISKNEAQNIFENLGNTSGTADNTTGTGTPDTVIIFTTVANDTAGTPDTATSNTPSSDAGDQMIAA